MDLRNIDIADPKIASALRGLGEQYFAQTSLIDFAKRVYPGFQTPPHLLYIADLLEQLERGDIRRLCISVPVRHGKSVLCSQIFPAWVVGRNPRKNVILASHAESLVILHSRVSKRIVEGDEWPWPDVKMSSDSASVQRWNVDQGGGMYAIGVGGAVTGRGADALIIDDALHDGLSQAERDSAWLWFTQVAYPRLEPGGYVIMIGARFAIDDLPGRIADSEEAAEWKYVNFPAIADDEDILGRKPGEALWPERMSLKELESRRISMGPYAFMAQFQQEPIPVGGQIFLDEWLDRTYATTPEMQFTVQTVDSAWKTGPQNDFSVIATWGFDGSDFYVLDVARGKWEFPDLARRVVERYGVLHPNAVLVEEQQSGLAILQQLRSTTGIPLIALRPSGTKESRAQAVTPYFEAHKVVLPERAPWLDDWKHEHLRFPAGKHDDQVDTTSMALSYLSTLIARPRPDYTRLQGFMER